MKFKRILFGVVSSFSLAAAIPLSAAAAPSTVLVTPSNTQGWSTSDTRPGGAVNFIPDASSPLPVGALQLTTDATTTAKAQYMHAANVPLASVNTLSYYTKQNSATPAVGDPSYQLPVCLTGGNGAPCNPGLTGTTAASSFATLVYEPYQNPTQGTITPNAWQQWNVAAGLFWSTRTVVCSGGTITGTAGGPASYTLAQVKTICPAATVIGYGVNIGSNNPSYNVETDAFVFNDTTYNFEQTLTPGTRSDCEGDNWKTFNAPAFKNGGQCIGYVKDHSNEVEGKIRYTAFGLNRRAEFEMNTFMNRGSFKYSDANGDSYKVAVSSVKVSGNYAWFAGVVTKASNPAWVGQWLFAKVENNNPDQIWGDFTSQAAAEAGVQSMSSPASGPFSVTKGNLKIEKN